MVVDCVARVVTDKSFTHLDTRLALQAEALEMDSCIGQRSWWRQTAMGRGAAYSVRLDGSRATVWLVPDCTGRLLLDEVFGPGNAPVSEAMSEWIASELARVNAQLMEEALASGRSLQRRPSVEAVSSALEELAQRVRARMIPVAPRVPRSDLSEPRPLAGLPDAYWVEHYPLFAHPPSWSDPDGSMFFVDRGSQAPRGQVYWDEAKGVLVAETGAGRWDFHPGLPLRVEAPPSSTEPPFLWMQARVGHRSPGVPEAAHQAQQRFLKSLPDWILETCEAVSGLRGMPGIWLLARTPALAPALRRYPFLSRVVLDRARESDAGLGAVAAELSERPETSSLESLCAWLGCRQVVCLDAVAERMDRSPWSRESLRTLARVLSAEGRVRGLLDRVPVVVPAHGVLLEAARQTGLLDRVTPSLLREIEVVYCGWMTTDVLGAIFAELEDAARNREVRIPRLRSLGHLASVLVRHRHEGVSRQLPPVTLAGPWGQAAETLEEVEGLATNLGCEPAIWRKAAKSGLYAFAGVPLGIPTVCWMCPSGLRGHLRLERAVVAGGVRAPQSVWRHLVTNLEAHSDRLAALPPGWTKTDAVAAGLSATLSEVSGCGRYGLDHLVSTLLGLRG